MREPHPTQRAGEAKPMKQAESECNDPGRAVSDSTLAALRAHEFGSEKENAQGDRGFHGRNLDVDEAESRGSQSDAVCDRERNNVRLNSAIGYVTPKDVLAGRQQEIHAERDRKLEAATQQRQSHRQQAA